MIYHVVIGANGRYVAASADSVLEGSVPRELSAEQVASLQDWADVDGEPTHQPRGDVPGADAPPLAQRLEALEAAVLELALGGGVDG